MHIPAMDALRHERVGIIEDDGAIFVAKTYVKTEETEERGAYDPTEGFARPFPMMLHSGGNTICVEEMIEDSEITPFSDTLINYISLLYQSMQNGEWDEKLQEFSESDFSQQELGIATSFKNFASVECPSELQRVYRSANRVGEESISTNSLVDIEGREQYDFDYLPSLSSVEEWELVRYKTSIEVDHAEEPAVSDAIWLRFSIGDSVEERPLITYQNHAAGVSALSVDSEFGSCGEAQVSEEIIESILNQDSSDSDSPLADFSGFSQTNSKTEEYLQEFLS